MASWLVILIVSIGWFLLFLTILSGVVIKCSQVVARAKAKEEYWYNRATQLQHIIDGYGMRELKIGKEKEKNK